MTARSDNPRAVAGDNSGTVAEGVEDQIFIFVERIERLLEAKQSFSDDIKGVYVEAKGVGFDVKILRKVIARRRADKGKLEEEEEMIKLYERAIQKYVR